MVSTPDLNALRELARQRHRAATRKVSRLNTQSGVEISGTSLDPRTEPAKIKRYTRKQLESYVNRLNAFTDRSTQYVALGDGEIITGKEWQKYKQPETRYNRRTNKRLAEVEDKELPSGTTIGRHLKTTTADRRSARGVAVNRPYDPPSRKPQDITDRKALKKLTKDYNRRIRTDFERKQVKAAQKVFHKMANIIKNDELNKAIASLTPDQFRVLWNYTDFANAVSQDYDVMMKMLTGTDKAYESDIYDQQLQEANDLAKWASTVKIKK